MNTSLESKELFSLRVVVKHMKIKIVEGTTCTIMAKTAATIKKRIAPNPRIMEHGNPVTKLIKGTNVIQIISQWFNKLPNNTSGSTKVNPLLKKERSPVILQHRSSRRGIMGKTSITVNNNKVGELPPPGSPKIKILSQPVDTNTVCLRVLITSREVINVTSDLRVS